MRKVFEGGRKFMENMRVSGTVQWFSRVKGYGFIRPDGHEEDVFVHYSVIQGEGYRNLSKGQRVELTVEDSPKGPQAVDVVGLEEPGAGETMATEF
jgi:CspA family cold shock protein